MKTLLFSLLLSFSALPPARADELVAEYRGGHRSSFARWEASVKTTRSWAGVEVSLLEVTYSGTRANHLCGSTNVGPSAKPVAIVFVLEGRSIGFEARVDCLAETAKARISSLSERALFDQIFPRRADGSRWYAFQLAAIVGHEWDSAFGRNYSFELERVR